LSTASRRVRIPSVTSRRHVPALDGLRGVAILLVLLVHVAVYLQMPEGSLVEVLVRRVALAGWVGVDLFFALSGFLITGILLDARGSARPWLNFYGRRFLRIFPPYYVFLTAYFFFVPRLSPQLVPPEVLHQAWYWTYLANVRIALVGFQDLGLIHFWSLAVEEQFYLAWPLLVLRLDRRALRRACLAMIAIAPLLRVACTVLHHPEAAYVLTPCRMDALAAGALIALLVRDGVEPARLARGARRALAASGAAIVAIAVARRSFVIEDPVVHTLGMSATAAASASVVALATLDGSRVDRVFRARPLRAIGVVSYGMYIVHLPLIGLAAIAGIDLRRAPSAVGGLALTYVVAVAVLYLIALAGWHAYEKRILTLKRWFEDRPAEEPAVAPVAPLE
jgi:peptidoglycan/LPS O-acetylase OafA/YrhL